MSRRVDRALDACLSSLAGGEDGLDECLARFPGSAEELRPLLGLATQIERVAPPKPCPQGSAAGRARMLAALEEKQARPAGVIPLLGAAPLRWRLPRMATVGVVALVVVLAGMLLGEFLLPPIVARAATLESLDGVVEIWLPHNQVWEQARSDARLPSGGRVRTGPSSSVTVALLGGGTVRVAAESEVELVELRSRPSGRDAVVVLRQPGGGTFSRLREGARALRRFEIETPYARVRAQSHGRPLGVSVDVGVYGTDVAVAEGQVSIESASGAVSLGPGETVHVESGPALATPLPSIEVTPQRGGERQTRDEGRDTEEPEQPNDGERGGEAPDRDGPAEDVPAGVGDGPAEGTPEPGAGDGTAESTPEPGGGDGTAESTPERGGGDGHNGEGTSPDDDPRGEGPEEGTPQAGEPPEVEPSPPGEGSGGEDGCEGTCTPTPGSGSADDDDGGAGGRPGSD